jgi:hypothetical protein
MSNFTKDILFTTEFEGDTVSLRLARLKRKDMMTLSPHMPDAGEKVGAVQSMDLMDVALALLPKYVTEFKGPKDADGNELSLEDIMEEMYFLELVSRIVTHLFEASNMGADEAKN